MEKGEILTIVFTLLTSILTSLVGSSVLTAYLNRRWTQSTKATSILEEQYLKVISPIYRELQLNTDKESMISNIENIMSDNFHLLPEQLLEKFKKIADNEYEFEILVLDFYAILRNELGYSKTKVSKAVREREKLLAEKDIIFTYSKRPFCLEFNIIFPAIIIALLMTIIIPFINYKWNLSDYFKSLPIKTQTLIFVLTSLFITLSFIFFLIRQKD